MSFCLKTNWRWVGVKRQKKLSFCAENSAKWKTTPMEGFRACLQCCGVLHRRNRLIKNCGLKCEKILSSKTALQIGSVIFLKEQHLMDNF